MNKKQIVEKFKIGLDNIPEINDVLSITASDDGFIASVFTLRTGEEKYININIDKLYILPEDVIDIIINKQMDSIKSTLEKLK